MPKEAKLKPHQLNVLISDYEELLKNKDCLKVIAEFVAKYRFLTLTESSDSPFSKIIYDDLYKTYIHPLITQLQTRYSTKDAQAKCDSIKTIIDLMIKESEYNDAWSALFVKEVYQKPSSWKKLYRSLAEELPNHRMKMVLNGNSEKIGSTSFSSDLQETNERNLRRLRYLRSHMPEDLDKNYVYARKTAIASSIALALLITHEIAQTQDPELQRVLYPALGIILIPTLPFLSLHSLVLANYSLSSSHLDFNDLPPNIRAGLLSEAREHIQHQIDFYTEQLPKKKPRDDGKRLEPGSGPAPENNKKTGTSNPAPAAPSTQDTAPAAEMPETKKDKQKRRGNYPTPTYSLADDTPVQRWKTKAYGEITFRPGRASDVIGLWAATKGGNKSKFDDRYAVLYPRKLLEQKGDKRQIASFWQTAAFGRIVHSQNEAGYVMVTEGEKQDPKYVLPQETVFKIKSFHEGEGRNRQPVVPCEVEGTDEDGIELLVALRPVRTHPGDT